MLEIERSVLLIMKRLFVVILFLTLSLSVIAQRDVYKAFAEKFERREGYDVSTIGRVALKAALVAADSKSREMLRNVDYVVTIINHNPQNGALKSELGRVVAGYSKVFERSVEEGSATAYLNGNGSGLVFFITTPKEQIALLIEGKNFNYEDFLPDELK